MPKRSFKENLISQVIESATMEFEDIDNLSEEAEREIDKFWDDLNEEIFAVSFCRYGNFTRVLKSQHWITTVFPFLDEGRFQQLARMNFDQFNRILSLIEHDELFHRTRSCQQFPPAMQLSIALFRLGSSGEGASIRKIASFFGIGDGGTIEKIIRRVFKALLKLRKEYIYWPNSDERESIVKATLSELPYCVGYLDGTELKLAEAPVNDPVSYFSRKRIYSIKAQIICDHKLKIRYLSVGFPGSMHDSRMFSKSPISQQPERFLSQSQFIAADSAYTLTDTVITPYRKNATMPSESLRNTFNQIHSQYRVRVEHCFGLLKEKFPSLKELKMRLHSKESHQFCCDWFYVCCMLHNILLPEEFSDEYKLIPEGDKEGIDNNSPVFVTRQGENKRNVICTLICNRNTIQS